MLDMVVASLQTQEGDGVDKGTLLWDLLHVTLDGTS